MSISTVPQATSPTAPSTRAAACRLSLVAGAAAVAAGRLLTINGGSPADRLVQAGAHQTRLTVSIVLAVIGFAALIVGFLGVAARVQKRGAALATVGSGLTVAGCVGFTGLVTVDAPTGAATHVADQAAMAQLLHRLDLAPAVLAITPVAVIGYLFGPFLVTLGARRAGLTPRWLPWLVLGVLVVQPLGAALGGPAFAHVADTVLQLALVVALWLLARFALADVSSARPSRRG
jgi:hypothetical protein